MSSFRKGAVKKKKKLFFAAMQQCCVATAPLPVCSKAVHPSFLFFISGHSFVRPHLHKMAFTRASVTRTRWWSKRCIFYIRSELEEEEHSLLESCNQSGFVLWNLMHITRTLSHNNQVREIPSVCLFSFLNLPSRCRLLILSQTSFFFFFFTSSSLRCF